MAYITHVVYKLYPKRRVITLDARSTASLGCDIQAGMELPKPLAAVGFGDSLGSKADFRSPSDDVKEASR